MIDQEIRMYVEEQIRLHIHDGNYAQRVNFLDIFLYTEPVNFESPTIATTGNTDVYFLAPRTMTLQSVYFSALDALAASDTNYITFSITNLGQTGAGSNALLGAVNANTTKVTGGSAIVANTKKTLTISTVANDLQVIQGDRIRIRAAATGTLANTVTFPNYLLIFQ